MARQNGQKTKLLFLYKLLLERGDEDNPISTPELIEALAARDIPDGEYRVYGAEEYLPGYGGLAGLWGGCAVQEGEAIGLVHRAAGV